MNRLSWIRYLVFALLMVVALQASLVIADEPVWPQLELEEVARGFTKPVHITHAGDGSGRVFVVEQPGRIWIVSQGALQATPFLDIADRVGSTANEQGLLSVAFPPGYAAKGYFYVNYTDKGGDTVVSRFHLSMDPNVADPDSEEILLTVDQPYNNHNGGQLAFGPDGYLYIGMGDGGFGGDPQNLAQNPGTLLGKMLRIDVESSEAPYAIPEDNPYVGVAGYRPEIWALGLRNPWRFSFDRETGELFMADVGQSAFEEVNWQPAESLGGENYGWNILEANHCYRPSEGCVPPDAYAPPIRELPHSEGWRSVTGGMVYRGDEFPNMWGVYFYADYVNGRIYGLRAADGGWESSFLLASGRRLSSFGEDEVGRVYVAAHDTGQIFLIQDTSPLPTATATASPTSTYTPWPSATPTVTGMPSPAPTLTATATASPTVTPTRASPTYLTPAHLPLVIKLWP